MADGTGLTAAGALMYGPPGTGKTLLARACAAQTDATFLKLAGPQLVQMFIGDGAKLVRDCFALAKEKAPAIIFIDELDAVGTKRFDSEKSGDREVQRTMLELLNQLDGFASDDRIKVLAATNRVDVLDPALLRSGRLDRKIEFPLPNEEARAQILKIHSRKMRVDEKGINWGELARSTDEFGGAMLKAVCVEAGMIALRMGKDKVSHEHYVDAIAEVQSKKKDVSTFCRLYGESADHGRLSTFMLNPWEPGRDGRTRRETTIDGWARHKLYEYHHGCILLPTSPPPVPFDAGRWRRTPVRPRSRTIQGGGTTGCGSGWPPDIRKSETN
jgi:hypothetical protein